MADLIVFRNIALQSRLSDLSCMIIQKSYFQNNIYTDFRTRGNIREKLFGVIISAFSIKLK